MKKIQTAIIIAAVTSVLVLTGCDAILEVFYPEFAAQKSGENVISIWTGIDVYPSRLSGSNQYITGQLFETKSGNMVRQIWSDPFWHWIEEKNNLYWHLEGNLDFYGVEDGEYEVLVWLEQTGDDEPYGLNEPYLVAVNITNGGTVFSFPNKDASDGWLDGEAIIPLR